jgi:hypothetical protein
MNIVRVVNPANAVDDYERFVGFDVLFDCEVVLVPRSIRKRFRA